MTEKEKGGEGTAVQCNYDPELIREQGSCQGYFVGIQPPAPVAVRRARTAHPLAVWRNRRGFLIEQPFMCDYGYNIVVGKNFYSNHNLIILDAARVTIGDNVFIAPNVGIYTAGHPLDLAQRAAGLGTLIRSPSATTYGLAAAYPSCRA